MRTQGFHLHLHLHPLVAVLWSFFVVPVPPFLIYWSLSLLSYSWSYLSVPLARLPWRFM